MSRVRLLWAWGPCTGPTASALAGRQCALWGWWKGVPRGKCRPLLRGASEFRRFPCPGFLSSGLGRRGLLPLCCGRGCAGVGTQHPLSPWLACPVGGCVPRGCCRGPSQGGVAFPLCEGCLASGAVPPLAARPLGRAAGVSRPVCPGCGWCRRVNPAPLPKRAPLRAIVARCGGGGRASPGGVPCAVVRGV